MPGLFDPITIGTLSLRNRIMRSATAERLADPHTGAPRPRLAALYQDLAEGGAGLIVTGHAYVDRGGQGHPEMAALDDDALIPAWRSTIAPAQAAGARVMVQINHAGASCDPAVTPIPLSPSGIPTNEKVTPLSLDEAQVQAMVSAFGQAARRAQAAGFDGVQIHGAHGYLVSQFLTPGTNRRTDRWGGDPERRLAFLAAVAAEVRRQVGAAYPVWIKLGVAGLEEHGFGVAEGVQAALACVEAGIDAVEISHALGVPAGLAGHDEPPYLPLAEAVRAAVGPDYPLALVNGFRHRQAMEEVLASRVVQLVSLCRPLIVEPDLPRKLEAGEADRASCARCSHCWPEAPGEGIACHNRAVRRRVAA